MRLAVVSHRGIIDGKRNLLLRNGKRAASYGYGIVIESHVGGFRAVHITRKICVIRAYAVALLIIRGEPETAEQFFGRIVREQRAVGENKHCFGVIDRRIRSSVSYAFVFYFRRDRFAIYRKFHKGFVYRIVCRAYEICEYFVSSRGGRSRAKTLIAVIIGQREIACGQLIVTRRSKIAYFTYGRFIPTAVRTVRNVYRYGCDALFNRKRRFRHGCIICAVGRQRHFNEISTRVFRHFTAD